MNAEKKPHYIADEESVLDAAEIVAGEDYVDHLPIEHLKNPAVVDELKRAGFTHAQAMINRYRLKTFRLD